VLVEVEEPGPRDRQGHGKQRAGHLPREPVGEQNHDQHGKGHQQSRPLGVGQRPQDREEVLCKTVTAGGDSEHVGQLADYQGDPDAAQETDQHRPGQEIGQEAQPEDAGKDEEGPRQEGGNARQRQPLRRAGAGQPNQPGEQDGRRGRVRADHQVARGAEEGEHGDGQQDRI